MEQTPSLSEIRAGLWAAAPPTIAAMPIGLLWGAIAAAKGLTPGMVALMSATVFAGGAQFAAIEQWIRPVPILTIAFGTLLINARHILMSTSIMPKTGAFSPLQRLAGFFFLADEIWALSEQRAAKGLLTPRFFLAMALPFYVNWVFWSVIGALVGPMMGDPARFGADFAFSALFIGLIAGFWRGRVTGAAIIASGVVAALVKITAGAPWHVPAGAIAGILAAYLAAPADEPADDTKAALP